MPADNTSKTFPIPHWSKLQFTYGTLASCNRRSYLFISQYPRYWKFQIISLPPLAKLMLSRKGRQQKWRPTNKLQKTDLVWFECKFHWNELAVRDASSGNQHADSDMTECIVLIKRKKVHCSCMTRSTASPSDLQVEQTTGGVVERIWAKIFGKHLESEFPCAPCVFASLRVPLLDIDLKMA